MSDPGLPADPLAAGDAGTKVIRGGGLRATAHVVGILAGLVSAPLVVRHLGLEDFGRLAVVTSVITVAVALTEGGLANVAVRRYATGTDSERRLLIRDLLGLRIVLALIAALGAVSFGLASGKKSVVVLGLALGGVGILFNALWGTLQTALVARLRLGSVALIDLVRAVLTTALLVALVIAGASLGAFFVVAPAVALSVLVLTAVLTRRDVDLRPRVNRAGWTSLLRETVLYAAATALGAVYFQVALVSMSVLSDAHETGVFSVAFRVVELANGVPWLLAGSVFPVLAHAAARDPERLAYAVRRTTEASLAAGAIVLVGFVLGAQVAIDVIGGSEAADAVTSLRILGVGAMATFLVAAWGFVLLSLERYRDLVVINATALVSAIALSAILIPALGAEGGAITTVALELGLATAYGFALTRARSELRPAAGNAGRLALATAAGLGAGAALLTVGALPAVLAGLAVTGGLLLALRALPEELLAALPGR